MIVNQSIKYKHIFEPKNIRYRAAYGGRGSGKSFVFSLEALIKARKTKTRVLCVRNFQNSIQESAYKDLCRHIRSFSKFNNFFTIQKTRIIGRNGSEFIFKGVKENPYAVKSYSDINLCWIEEAEDLSELSLQVLKDTIREENSEIWMTWNPLKRNSAVDSLIRQNFEPQYMVAQEVHWYDNPVFNKSPLAIERKLDKKRLPPEKYNNVWLGAYLDFIDKSLFNMGRISTNDNIYDDKLSSVAGLDIAESGDFTAISILQGSELVHLEKWQGDLMLTATKVLNMCDKFNIRTIGYDTIGIGAGVGSRLKQILPSHINIIPINHANPVINPDTSVFKEGGIKNKEFFSNLKAQNWYNLKIALENQQLIILNHKELLDQLSNVCYNYDTKSRIKIDKHGLSSKSPDLADSLVLALYSQNNNSIGKIFSNILTDEMVY